MKRRAALALLGALAGGALQLWGLGLSNERGSVSIVTSITDIAGWAAIEVHSSVPGSTVSINRVDASYNSFQNGYIPPGGGYTSELGPGGVDYSIYQNNSLAPGGYIIGVSAPGYYKREIALVLSEKTKYTLYFTLAMISGTLDLSVSPPDATISVDDRSIAAGGISLPVGGHNLELRRFGYLDRSVPVLIRENETTHVSVDLEKAPFAVSRLSSSRTVFNPANAGLFGVVDIRFRVESFGRAQLKIENSAGEIVAHKDFPSFETWRQSYRWNGRGADGRPLPDGSYHAILTAEAATTEAATAEAATTEAATTEAATAEAATAEAGAPPPAGAPIQRQLELRIDSALSIRPRGSLSAVPGLAFFSDPRGQPDGMVSNDFTWLSPLSSLQNPSFALSGVAALSNRVDLGYSAALENLASPSGGGDFALSSRLGLWETDGRFSNAGSLFLRGSYSSCSAPLLPDAANSIELALPLDLYLGALGLGPLSVGAAPGFRLSFPGGAAEPSLVLRDGLWWSSSAWRAGLSSETGLAWSGGSVTPIWPFEIGLDIRVLLPPSPLELSLSAMSQLSSSPTYTLGLGLGLLF